MTASPICVGDGGGVVDGFDGAGWVGEPHEVGDAARQSAAYPLLAFGVLKEGGGRPQPLGRGQPGVGALGPVTGREQPLPGARIAGRLKVIGDRIGIGTRMPRRAPRRHGDARFGGVAAGRFHRAPRG